MTEPIMLEAIVEMFIKKILKNYKKTRKNRDERWG